MLDSPTASRSYEWVAVVVQRDLAALSASVEAKVGRDEVQQLLRRASTQAAAACRAEALEAVAAATQPSAARALKATCLSCNREVSPTRPAPVGSLASAAGTLPLRESFASARARPATAGAIPSQRTDIRIRALPRQRPATAAHLGVRRRPLSTGAEGVGTELEGSGAHDTTPTPVFV